MCDCVYSSVQWLSLAGKVFISKVKVMCWIDGECMTHGCFRCFPARRQSSAGCLRARRRPARRCPAAWWRRAADLRSRAPSTPSSPAAAAGYSPSPPSPAAEKHKTCSTTDRSTQRALQNQTFLMDGWIRSSYTDLVNEMKRCEPLYETMSKTLS